MNIIKDIALNLIHRIKSKFSECYRIKMGFGLNAIRSQKELEALIYFCKEELKEEHMEFNPKSKAVLKKTIRLYEAHRECEGCEKCIYNDVEMFDYINKNWGYYWS